MTIGTEEVISKLTAQRDRHMQIAIGSTLESLVPKGDLHWLITFSSEGDLDLEQIRKFINTYKLQRQGTWNYEKVAEKLGSLKNPCNIGDLAKELSRLVKRKNNPKERMQLSAASKFAFFTIPNEHYFILDSLAKSALQLR